MKSALVVIYRVTQAIYIRVGHKTEDLRLAPFHHSKRVAEVEWWLEWAALPDRITWGRVRVFEDGTADVSFGPEGGIYGFENRIYAGYFLSEDDFFAAS